MPSSAVDPPVLFVSNYYPPEVNALATRTAEHVRMWVEHGGTVEVLTDVPHFPEGVVYAGYKNRFSRTLQDGYTLLRVPLIAKPNKGFAGRLVSYLSFMLSAIWFSRKASRPAAVVGSTPQPFGAFAALIISRMRRALFVLEVRDLWPETMDAVGVLRDGWIYDVLERLETLLYRAADHVVIVSPAFRAHIRSRGISDEDITLLPNGVDLMRFDAPLSEATLEQIRCEHGLKNKYVVSYVGTIGMCHGLDVVLRAAELDRDDRTVYLLVELAAETVVLVVRVARWRPPEWYEGL